jgi:hypothetical protein
MTLFNIDPPVNDEEILAASRQYVRKISGYNKPSRVNEAAFATAVDEIAAATRRLLVSLESAARPKDREVESAKRKARAAQRQDSAGARS